MNINSRYKILISIFFIINFIPIINLAREENLANEVENECAICMENSKDSKTLLCGHKFCTECIRDWHNRSDEATCPTCRRKIEYLTQLQCKLCSRNFKEMDQLTRLKCDYSHVYHNQCLKNGLKQDLQNNSCPACNQKFEINKYFPELLQINNIAEHKSLRDIEDVKEELPIIVPPPVKHKKCRQIKDLIEEAPKIIQQPTSHESSKDSIDLDEEKPKLAQKVSKSKKFRDDKKEYIAKNKIKVQPARFEKNNKKHTDMRNNIKIKNKRILDIINFMASDVAFNFFVGGAAHRVINNKQTKGLQKPIILAALGLILAKYNIEINAKIIERKNHPKLAFATSILGLALGYKISNFFN